MKPDREVLAAVIWALVAWALVACALVTLCVIYMRRRLEKRTPERSHRLVEPERRWVSAVWARLNWCN